MFRLFSLLIGYFLGSISFSYIMGKINNVDIRKVGSGNLGTTNTIRALGKKIGAITFVLDVFKSIAAYLICSYLFNDFGLLAGFYASAGAILGHDFPFYLKFKGGKGIAATIGLIAVQWNIVSLICAVIGIGFGLSGYISLGSLAFVITIPFALLKKGYPLEIVLLSSGLSALAIIKHRENIKRLLQGNENKLFFKKE